jgi:hypothetical protein
MAFDIGAYSREKADGRYAAGLSLRLQARPLVPSRLIPDCIGMVNERLISGRPIGARQARPRPLNF